MKTEHFDNGVTMTYREGTHDEQIMQEVWHRREYWLPNYEIEPGNVVIDIGAHIGIFSLWATLSGAEVWAFEPEPENYMILCKNVKQNMGWITALRNGIHKAPGKRLLFKWQKSPGNMGSYSMIWGEDSDAVEVDCITLAEALIMAGGKCDFLKIDCEGAEYDILYALPAWKFRSIRRIVCEWHGSQDDAVNLADYLREQGYILDRYGMESHEIVNGKVWARGHIFARRGEWDGERYD